MMSFLFRCLFFLDILFLGLIPQAQPLSAAGRAGVHRWPGGILRVGRVI